MKCRVCGNTLCATTTDLPFKVSDRTIVILKHLPIAQCEGCSEYLIADAVFPNGTRPTPRFPEVLNEPVDRLPFVTAPQRLTQKPARHIFDVTNGDSDEPEQPVGRT